MNIKTSAVAGTLESSDVYVKVEPSDKLEIEIESVVYNQYADQIKQSVQQVLDELEFQIINQPGQFYILDPSGKQITFDFIRGGPAEKVFLKILFPVVIPHGR